MVTVSATTESAAEEERSSSSSKGGDDDDREAGGSDRDNDEESGEGEDEKKEEPEEEQEEEGEEDEEEGEPEQEEEDSVASASADAKMGTGDDNTSHAGADADEEAADDEEMEEAEEDDAEAEADEDANEIVPDPVVSDLTAVATTKTANKKHRSRSSTGAADDDDLLPSLPSLRVTQRDRTLRSVPAILNQSKCVLLLEVLRLLDVHKTHRKDPLNRRANWTALHNDFHRQPMASRYRHSGNAGKFKKRIFHAFQAWKEWARERGFDFVGVAANPRDDADRARAKEFVRLLYKIDAESKGEKVPDDIASGDEGGDGDGDDGGGKKKGKGRASAAADSRSGLAGTSYVAGAADAAPGAGGSPRRSPRRPHPPNPHQNPPAGVADFSSAVSDLIRADAYAAASGAEPEARRTALVGYYVAEAVAHQRAHTHLLKEELRSHRAARDEEDIRRLEDLQAKIDSYGVGGASASAGGGGGGGVPLHVYVELRDRCLARLSRSGREGADDGGGGGGERMSEAHV